MTMLIIIMMLMSLSFWHGITTVASDQTNSFSLFITKENVIFEHLRLLLRNQSSSPTFLPTSCPFISYCYPIVISIILFYLFPFPPFSLQHQKSSDVQRFYRLTKKKKNKKVWRKHQSFLCHQNCFFFSSSVLALSPFIHGHSKIKMRS